MTEQSNEVDALKLYMLLLGSKAPGRHVEQHDFFFGIAKSLNDLVPEIKSFWPEAGDKIHIDAWREVTFVDGHLIKIASRNEQNLDSDKKLFFINLGGYQENKFEEQHYTILTVKTDRAAASNEAKKTLFFKNNSFEDPTSQIDATSHIDDKYGIDVDDIYQIEDILSPTQKERYRIQLLPSPGSKEDPIHLGYLKLKALK